MSIKRNPPGYTSRDTSALDARDIPPLELPPPVIPAEDGFFWFLDFRKIIPEMRSFFLSPF